MELQIAINLLRNKCPDYIKVVQHFPEFMSICVNYKDLVAAGPVGIHLADKLIEDPKYTFSTLENALFELAKVSRSEAEANRIVKDTRFRFINLPIKRRIRMIRAKDVNRFLSFEGICRMVSAVKPKITVAVFRCKHCGNTIRVPQRGRTLESPQNVECANCNSQQWNHEVALDTFANVQFVNIQEFQEGLKAAEQPHSIRVEVSDDLNVS